ncbi:MAG: hypothetical protein NTW79_02205 [Candidatus Berkelbacteria bacterium]|nr:hypothetical protein [Candidatus Berkelbacteria bacterium]
MILSLREGTTKQSFRKDCRASLAMTISKKSKLKTKKGTALIVAIFMVAIIGSAAIGINAVALRQINISETYNNGLVAYYSAESGIEEGLLRFRFDKNAEVPKIIDDATVTSDLLNRQPLNVFRNYLAKPTMRTNQSDNGTVAGYSQSDRQQIYDLSVFYKQKFAGVNTNGDGKFDASDLAAVDLNSIPADYNYIVQKDNQKSYTISQTASPQDNNIYLFWRWLKPCSGAGYSAHALEVKLKLDTSTLQNNQAGIFKDEYTGLFKDTTCDSIANANNASIVAGTTNVYSAGELKAALEISALNVKEMSIKPIGNTAGSGDGVIFGFVQGLDFKTKVAGPTTTVNSIGYFFGASRQITADISRQTGTILDLFNYVIYKGGN